VTPIRDTSRAIPILYQVEWDADRTNGESYMKPLVILIPGASQAKMDHIRAVLMGGQYPLPRVACVWSHSLNEGKYIWTNLRLCSSAQKIDLSVTKPNKFSIRVNAVYVSSSTDSDIEHMNRHSRIIQG
jgi:hypothetical protein